MSDSRREIIYFRTFKNSVNVKKYEVPSPNSWELLAPCPQSGSFACVNINLNLLWCSEICVLQLRIRMSLQEYSAFYNLLYFHGKYLGTCLVSPHKSVNFGRTGSRMFLLMPFKWQICFHVVVRCGNMSEKYIKRKEVGYCDSSLALVIWDLTKHSERLPIGVALCHMGMFLLSFWSLCVHLGPFFKSEFSTS